MVSIWKNSFCHWGQVKTHPYFNYCVNIMVWLMLLQSPSMAEKKKYTIFVVEGAGEEQQCPTDE